MAIKFANIRAAMKMVAGQESVTEAHLQAADDRIAQLELEKTAAETNLTAVQGELTTAKADLSAATTELATANTTITTVQGELTTANDKVATLEEWKKKQAAADGRTEDDSNKIDTDDAKPKAAWETASASAVASVKKRLGEK